MDSNRFLHPDPSGEDCTEIALNTRIKVLAVTLRWWGEGEDFASIRPMEDLLDFLLREQSSLNLTEDQRRLLEIFSEQQQLLQSDSDTNFTQEDPEGLLGSNWFGTGWAGFD